MDLSKTYKNIPSRMKAEAFKQRVVACFRAWEDWALYPMDFLIKLQNIFLGLVSTEPEPEEEERRPSVEDGGRAEDCDGDVDGIPLDGAALLKASGGGQGRGHDDFQVGRGGDGAPAEGQEGADGECG